MKKIIFNDSRQLEVQSVTASDGVLHARMILTNAETLKAVFADTFATSKMTLVENGKVIETYENYTNFIYVKEETGGIWEVEMVQPEADMRTRMTDAEAKIGENAANMEMAIAELTMVIATLTETLTMTETEEEENV